MWKIVGKIGDLFPMIEVKVYDLYGKISSENFIRALNGTQNQIIQKSIQDSLQSKKFSFSLWMKIENLNLDSQAKHFKDFFFPFWLI